VAGVEAPAVSYSAGRMVREASTDEQTGADPPEVLGLRTAWSHDAFMAGEPTRLIALPEIADGWHVYAENDAEMVPFSLEVELPEGLSLDPDTRASDGAVTNPAPMKGHDALLDEDLAWYVNDIPVQALTFTTSPELEPGTELTVRLIAHYQACNAELCTPPETQVWELTLPVVTAGSSRGQLYGWQGW
jgi:hypothetical protein